MIGLTMRRKIIMAVTVGLTCLAMASCKGNDGKEETGANANGDEIGYEVIEWENDPTIGKVQAGYYKRVGIVKNGETYEEMLELRDVEKKGYLVVYADGTAVFELDGEKTKYVYDKLNLYLSDDTEKTNGIPYVYVGGRLVVNDGTTITQYLMLSEEELAAYLKSDEER